MTKGDTRIPSESLRKLMSGLLQQAGLDTEMAEATGSILLESDLLGHRTHGVALMPTYLDCLRDGWMARNGTPETVSERGAAALWDGKRIAGAWLTLRAIRLAEKMAGIHGTGTVVIRRSFHIGCLAAYLEPVARRGLVLLLQSSAPQAATVAP